LTDFQAPLELFSLEEEAALLPGGLFVFASSHVKLSSRVFGNHFWFHSYYGL